MGRRSKKAAAGLVAFAVFGLLVVCCGGPCALFTNSRTAQSPRTTPSPTGSVSSATNSPVVPNSTEKASGQTDSKVIQPPPTPRAPSTVPPPAATKVAETAEPKDDGSAAALASLPVLETPTVREWASSSGKFRINGTFTGFSSGDVKLLKESGNSTAVALEKLSTADRQYVKDAIKVDKDAKVIIGKVVEVIDGDTITVLDEDKKQHKIRLEGIDAPESGQAFGAAAKKALSEKIFNQTPWIEWKSTDKDDRILGHIYLEGRHINLELVGEGYGWHYKEYSKDPRLANAEMVARHRKLGLWTDSSPTPPWDFRRSKRN